MRVSATILIQRPIADVFSFVSNPGHLPAWVAGVAAADGPTECEQGIGETFVLRDAACRGLAESIWEVTSYEPPRTLALRCLDGPQPVEARWILERCPSGATRVSVEADLTAVSFFPPGPVELGDLGSRQLRADLEVLRDQLEAWGRLRAGANRGSE